MWHGSFWVDIFLWSDVDGTCDLSSDLHCASFLMSIFSQVIGLLHLQCLHKQWQTCTANDSVAILFSFVHGLVLTLSHYSINCWGLSICNCVNFAPIRFYYNCTHIVNNVAKLAQLFRVPRECCATNDCEIQFPSTFNRMGELTWIYK